MPYASPAIRAFARELGVDLFRVSGSGRKGRILRADITAFVKAVMAGSVAAPAGGLSFDLPEAPAIDFSKFGDIERQPLSRIKKISGKNLHRNWLSIPHVTQNDLADITGMEAMRRTHKGEAEAALRKEQVQRQAGVSQLEITADDEHVIWPFEGEYWKDELGTYRFRLASQCGKK